MTSARNSAGNVVVRRGTLVLALALVATLAIGAVAQAASPAWKMLALTGPTYLPPKQSEIQRVTVEAEGGTFTLSKVNKGEATPVFLDAQLSLTEGSAVATIESLTGSGKVEVGDRVSLPEEYGGSYILSCSADCKTPGSTIELSEPAGATESAHRQILTRELNGVVGSFQVGEEITEVRNPDGEGPFPYFPPGTVVTAVGPGTMTLSNPTTGEYATWEGTIGGLQIKTGVETAPIAYDASAGTVQSALTAALGAGSAIVTGGPGGTPEHPYFVEFAGALAEQDVAELTVDTSDLDGEHAAVHVTTTLPGGPGTGQIAIDPANIGGADTTGEYTVELGPLPPGIVISGPAVTEKSWNCPDATGEDTLACTSTDPVPRLTPANNIVVPVEVLPSIASTASAAVTISGGGAGSDSVEFPIVVAKQDAPAGAAAFWAGAFDENGNPEVQAGGHPYSAQSFFLLNTIRAKSGKIVTVGDPRNVIVDLPPGFTGNPMVTPRCPQNAVVPSESNSPACTRDMSVGVFMPSLDFFGESSSEFAFNVFNDVPPKGYAAEFTTKIVFPLQSLLGSVRSSEDFGVRITAPNNPNYAPIFGAYAALEGFPEIAKGVPFFRNVTECSSQAPVVRTKSQTWQEPGTFSVAADQVLPAITGCDKLKFHPDFSFQPTTTDGSSGTGATVDVHIPQEGLVEAGKLATPDLKKTVATLPEGLILNPASANGLESCSEAQIGYIGKGFPMPNPTRFNEDHASCPDGSKLGTAEIVTPMLDHKLGGSIYLAAQEENPFDSLLAIYLVVDDPQSGIVMKLPGEVKLDPQTGQMTAIFDNSPQLPFEHLILHFRGGGPRSELATPEVCGHYATKGELTPWSAPASGPPAQIEEAGFTVGGNCASSLAARPFAPSFEAGTSGTKAGGYSPLVVKVNRKDGEQELRSLDFTLPKGLIGKLAGIPYCSEAQIAVAEGRSGKAEQASPSCPANARLGSIDTAAGVGSEPFHVGGTLYLAGPYKGAPVSAVVVSPGVAGPIDLGNVVIRTPLYLDPESAQLTAKSDPIPTILKGFRLKVRSVEIKVDRANFIVNPTNCEPMKVSASIAGNSGAIAAPSNRFQVGGCADLKFGPKLALSVKGGTRRNGNPALTAILTQPQGEANIGKVAVTLPHSEFLDQSHIRTVCTRVQFAAQACPRGSIYGEAEAITPLLDQPLKGPVYLRSSSNKLPDLVVALKGPASQPIEVNLAGRIDSVNGGIRNSFELVPDAPVSKFVLKMQGGKKGLLVNSTNICRRTNKATVKMEGQNGKVSNFSSPLKAQCGGKKPNNSKKQSKRATSAAR